MRKAEGAVRIKRKCITKRKKREIERRKENLCTGTLRNLQVYGGKFRENKMRGDTESLH